MAKKPVITIDVNDDQFSKFYSLFNKYQDQVKEMPEAWKGANEVLNAGVAAIAEQTHNIAKHLNSAITAQKQFANATHTSFTGMKKMAGEAKKVADSIFGIGKFVLKMGAWGGGLFAGSLFGIDKLAGSALTSARGARGIGVSPGSLRAFGTDYRQIAPDNLPNSVFDAQHDFSKLGMLAYAAGLTPGQVQNMDPVALSQRLVQRAHDYYRQNKNNPAMMAQTAAAMMGFQAGGLGVEDVERAGTTPQSEISEAAKQTLGDSRRFNYSDQTLHGLREFQRDIQAAGQALETDLSKRLSKLGPNLGGLVTTLEKDAEKLLNGILSDKNINAIQTELNKFVTFLNSGKASDAFAKFTSSLGDLADLIHKIAHPADSAGDWVKHHIMPHLPKEGSGIPVLNKFLKYFSQGPLGIHAAPSVAPVISTGKASLKRYADLQDVSNGLPAGSTWAMMQVESSGNARAVSSKGAQGLMQLMPGTATGLGVTDPFNPQQSLTGGAKYLAELRAQMRKLAPGASGLQNMEMAVAAYNWGPGNFSKYYKRHADKGDWLTALPGETKGEISRFLDNLPTKSRDGLNTPLLQQIARNTAQPVKIEITSTTPTSSRVAMQANAAR